METIAGLRIRASVLEELLQKVIAFAQEPYNMERIDTYITTPLLNNLFQKIFPYLVLTAVMFLLLFTLQSFLGCFSGMARSTQCAKIGIIVISSIAER